MKEGRIMAILSLSGANGQLYLFEDHLEIHRDGVLARLTHMKNRFTIIDYDEIARVKMHLGVFPVSGYFYFERKGSTTDCGLIDAARDEDCIVFRAFENSTAREIKKFLKRKI